MLFSRADPTPYDLRFPLLGVPVRISPMFWVIALFLGGDPSPLGASLWVVAVLVSILVHELGHAIVQRLFGGDPEIVLYGLGGYAAATGVHDTPMRSVLIALAGPAAGLGLWAVVRGLFAAELLSHDPRVLYVMASLIFINWWWSLLNLLPVWPLDGGRVAREVAVALLKPSTGIVVSLVVSMVTAAVVAALLYQSTRSLWNTALFGLLAYQSYETLARYRVSRGGW